MQEHDYIERLIRQISTAITTILDAASAGRFEEAESDLDRAWFALGLRRGDALRLDDHTLRALLGAKTEFAARLLDTEASVEEARDAAGTAATLRAHAARLRAPLPSP